LLTHRRAFFFFFFFKVLPFPLASLSATRQKFLQSSPLKPLFTRRSAGGLGQALLFADGGAFSSFLSLEVFYGITPPSLEKPFFFPACHENKLSFHLQSFRRPCPLLDFLRDKYPLVISFPWVLSKGSDYGPFLA